MHIVIDMVIINRVSPCMNRSHGCKMVAMEVEETPSGRSATVMSMITAAATADHRLDAFLFADHSLPLKLIVG